MSIFNKRFNFLIDSQFRNSGSTSKFNFTIPMPSYNEFDSVLVSNAIIPKSYYLIRAGYNTFTVVEEGVSITVPLSIGNYNLNDFLINVKSSLNSVSTLSGGISSYNITYDKALGKFTFICLVPTIIQPKFTFTNNIYETMGFDKNTTYAFFNNSLQSANVINLNPQEMIYIISDLVNNSIGQVLEVIPVCNIPDWSFQYFQTTSIHTTKELTNRHNTTFNFTITDSSFRELDLNGKNVVFSICCHKNTMEETNSMLKENILINHHEKLLKSGQVRENGVGIDASSYTIGFI